MGGKSQAFGSLFETIFLKTCRSQGVAITRIPDGCRQVGKRIIRVKTPWDWVVSYQNRTALIDTKTVNADVFIHSAITEHQVNELFNHERSGALAGYVIWLRLTNRVFFMPAYALMQALQAGGSFSESHVHATYLGTNHFDIRPIFKEPL